MNVATVRRVRDLLDEVLSTPLAKLGESGIRERLEQLQGDLPGVQAFVERMARLLGEAGGGGSRRGRPPAAAKVSRAASRRVPGRKGRGRRRRRAKRSGLKSTAFVLQAVKGSGRKGIAPREIVAMVNAAVPGFHANPYNLVSPLLNRLKKRGQVRNRAGRWFAK